MRKLTTAFLVILLSFSCYCGIEPELKIGAILPKSTVELKDVSGKTISLQKAKKNNGILIIFSCNTCPYVKLNEERIKQYTDFALNNGIGVVILNSSEAPRGEVDSYEEMKNYHQAQKLNGYYVVDTKSELADAFGATRTPQCFLFNSESILIYKGAIDDNVKDIHAVNQHYLKEALNDLIQGKSPAIKESKSVGCTIKREE